MTPPNQLDPTARPRRRFRFQFSLRTALIAITVLCVIFAAIGNGLRDRRERLAALELLHSRGLRTYCSSPFEPTRWQKMIAWLAGDEKTEDAFATEVYSRTINIHAQDPIYLLASLIDADVPCLCVLPELKRVAFYTATKLTPAGYHELAKLPQLEQVTLSTETKEFLLGGHLESAAQLREVGFDTMTIDANMVAALNRLPRLKSLEFYGCDLSPGVLDRLQLPNLEHFNGMDSSLTNEHLAVIGKQRSLQVIDIQASDITGDAYRHLAALPNLKELHTYGASIDDESAKCVKDMRSLTLLNIDWTEITAPAVSKILKDCPRLVLRCNVQASGLTPAEQTEVKRRYDEWHARP